MTTRNRMLSAAVAATLAGGSIFGFNALQQSAQADPPARLNSQEIAGVDNLASAMKQVGKAVEPAVVSIEVEKTATAARGGGGGQPDYGDMLRRLFPDADGDGEPDVPPQLRQRFAPPGDEGEAAPNDSIPGPRVQGEGSGVILDVTGDTAYIVTNNHVAGDATKLTVTLADGRQIDDVKVVGTDPLSDIAVLQIKAEGLKAARWGDSSTIDKGDIVLAFGAPFGYVGSMTQGIVSALNRSKVGILDRVDENGKRVSGYENFIQTDCAINPGNSGGPLVNIHGEIIGINTAIASRTGGFNGIGFAIPADLAKFVYEQIKNDGHVTRGFLGVQIGDASALPKNQAKALGLGSQPSGAFVSMLQNDTPAAGVLQPNDVIVKMDGKPVATMQDLRLRIATTTPGTSVTLGIIRDGKPKDVQVKLGTLPGGDTKVAAKSQKETPNASPQLGATLADANEARLKSLGLPTDAKGALVTGVKNNSPAFDAGLKNGDLITKVGDKDVSTASEAADAIKAANLKDGLSMLVTTKEGAKSVFVEVADK